MTGPSSRRAAGSRRRLRARRALARRGAAVRGVSRDLAGGAARGGGVSRGGGAAGARVGRGRAARRPALRERVLARVGEGKTQALAASPAPPRADRRRAVARARGQPARSPSASARGWSRRGAGSPPSRPSSPRATRCWPRREQQLTEREATLNSILEPGVQLFQLTASGDPEPGIQLFWNRAAAPRHRARLPAQGGARGTGVPALVHQGRRSRCLRSPSSPSRTATPRWSRSRFRRRHAQRRGDHRRARGRLAAADLADRDGGSAQEVLSPDASRRAAMSAARTARRALGVLGPACASVLVSRRLRAARERRRASAPTTSAWLTTAPTSPLAAVAQQPIGRRAPARTRRRRRAARWRRGAARDLAGRRRSRLESAAGGRRAIARGVPVRLGELHPRSPMDRPAAQCSPCSARGTRAQAARLLRPVDPRSCSSGPLLPPERRGTVRVLGVDGIEVEAAEAGSVVVPIGGERVRLRVRRLPTPGGEESELEIFFRDATNGARHLSGGPVRVRSCPQPTGDTGWTSIARAIRSAPTARRIPAPRRGAATPSRRRSTAGERYRGAASGPARAEGPTERGETAACAWRCAGACVRCLAVARGTLARRTGSRRRRAAVRAGDRRERERAGRAGCATARVCQPLSGVTVRGDSVRAGDRRLRRDDHGAARTAIR